MNGMFSTIADSLIWPIEIEEFELKGDQEISKL
jgi:hypothetical protein